MLIRRSSFLLIRGGYLSHWRFISFQEARRGSECPSICCFSHAFNSKQSICQSGLFRGTHSGFLLSVRVFPRAWLLQDPVVSSPWRPAPAISHWGFYSASRRNHSKSSFPKHLADEFPTSSPSVTLQQLLGHSGSLPCPLTISRYQLSAFFFLSAVAVFFSISSYSSISHDTKACFI